MGVAICTNSKGGNSDNPKNLKILKINIGKNNFGLLLLLLEISTMVWINKEGKHMEPSVTKA